MSGFQIERELLVELVGRCQTRIFDDELGLLQQHAEDPTDHLLMGTVDLNQPSELPRGMES